MAARARRHPTGVPRGAPAPSRSARQRGHPLPTPESFLLDTARRQSRGAPPSSAQRRQVGTCEAPRRGRVVAHAGPLSPWPPDPHPGRLRSPGADGRCVPTWHAARCRAKPAAVPTGLPAGDGGRGRQGRPSGRGLRATPCQRSAGLRPKRPWGRPGACRGSRDAGYGRHPNRPPLSGAPHAPPGPPANDDCMTAFSPDPLALRMAVGAQGQPARPPRPAWRAHSRGAQGQVRWHTETLRALCRKKTCPKPALSAMSRYTGRGTISKSRAPAQRSGSLQVSLVQLEPEQARQGDSGCTRPRPQHRGAAKPVAFLHSAGGLKLSTGLENLHDFGGSLWLRSLIPYAHPTGRPWHE